MLHHKITVVLSSLMLSSFILSGCQLIRQQPKLPTQNAISNNNQFNLQGKIGVRTPQQSGSAFYTWQQDQDHFVIQLNGALGIGKTIIEGKPGEVVLNSSKTGELRATSPEELLAQATGWIAPITHMIDWVQARPATAAAQSTRDQQNRLIQVTEDGWQVELFYAESAILPNKLILTEQLAEQNLNKITLIIENR
ncbi:outer membrane lipoprotein LolB [Acinetobacter larvae]|uniref:Outer-membrane lipoprotein LolB n=2 Tax=Acinetobacter larvae TaxID=1789224 RepID=A0A1B2LXV7_9GAMM|nr:lipoprotein insertase outer membrane protein LolB [Acinetobacter larvae]AOA57777.1 outer membrane lipoprotein LolB [Acinetobacter larvae]